VKMTDAERAAFPGDKLRQTVLAHVARNERRFSNPTAAAALMLGALQRSKDAYNSGTSLARALYDEFNDRILTALEKAAGVPVTFGGGRDDKGRPA